MTVSVGTDSSQLLVNATAEVDLSAGNFTGLPTYRALTAFVV
jgi:hypothetical protein